VARGSRPGGLDRDSRSGDTAVGFGVRDGRVQHNVAAVVRKPTSGRVRRGGQVRSLEELLALTEACKSRYRDVVPVPVLALAGCDGASWLASRSVTGCWFLVPVYEEDYGRPQRSASGVQAWSRSFSCQ